MFFYQIEWVVAAVLAYTFFTMGKYDAHEGARKDHSLLWAGISFALSAAAIHWFHASYLDLVMLQIIYYFSIAVVAVYWEQRRGK